ncbi:MAG: hypothetical protein KDD40_09035 [Bdellovibrionales bacterium]|nr:hypothetical protein [Bdellovibrionales bacterium]
MRRFLGLAILMIGVLLGVKIVFDYYSFHVAPIEYKFQTLWAKDMEVLEKEHKLPKNWDEISEIKYTLPTDNVKKWLKSITAPVVLKKSGSHRLDITITDWEENNKTGIVVQYQLIDKTSGDLVSEFGRTFIFDKAKTR